MLQFENDAINNDYYLLEWVLLKRPILDYSRVAGCGTLFPVRIKVRRASCLQLTLKCLRKKSVYINRNTEIYYIYVIF